MTNPNTADEIAKIIFQLGKLHERGEIDYDLSKPVSLIEGHSQSQLQELRDRVEKLVLCKNDWGANKDYVYGNNDCVKEVLNLIDQLQKD